MLKCPSRNLFFPECLLLKYPLSNFLLPKCPKTVNITVLAMHAYSGFLSISADLMAMIQMYERYLHKPHQKRLDLYNFIYQTYDSDCDTDTTEEHSMGENSPEGQYWKHNQPSPDYAANTP